MTTGPDTLYTGALPSKHTSKEESKRTRKNRATPKASNQATEQPYYSLELQHELVWWVVQQFKVLLRTHEGTTTGAGVVGGAAV